MGLLTNGIRSLEFFISRQIEICLYRHTLHKVTNLTVCIQFCGNNFGNICEIRQNSTFIPIITCSKLVYLTIMDVNESTLLNNLNEIFVRFLENHNVFGE